MLLLKVYIESDLSWTCLAPRQPTKTFIVFFFIIIVVYIIVQFVGYHLLKISQFSTTPLPLFILESLHPAILKQGQEVNDLHCLT